MKTTVSVHWNQGEIAEEHNQRKEELCKHEEHIDLYNEHGDSYHEVWYRKDLQQAYTEIFGEVIDEYNVKQKRKDRMKTVESYMAEVKNDTRGKRQTKKVNGKSVVDEDARKGKQLAYEITVKVGNTEREKDGKGRVLYDSTGHHIRPEYLPRELQRNILKKYCDTFQEVNPNFIVTNVDLHADEGFYNKHEKWEYDVIHPHIRFIPVATGFKQGLSKQNSMNKALASMGYGGNDGYELWAKAEQERLEAIVIEQYKAYCINNPIFAKEHGELEIYHPVHSRTKEGGKCKEVFVKEQELAEEKAEFNAEYNDKMTLFRNAFRKYQNDKEEWNRAIIDTEIELNQLQYNIESISLLYDEKEKELEHIEVDTIKRNQEAIKRLKTANTGSEKVMGAFIRKKKLNDEFALFCEDYFEVPIVQKSKSYSYSF